MVTGSKDNTGSKDKGSFVSVDKLLDYRLYFLRYEEIFQIILQYSKTNLIIIIIYRTSILYLSSNYKIKFQAELFVLKIIWKGFETPSENGLTA